MKTFFRFILLGCMPVLYFSCKKETINKSSISTAGYSNDESRNANGDCERKWFGLYANEIQPNDTISQNTIIKDGIAQLPPVNWYNYHTGLYYDIPLCHKICGDSIRFEVRVKNPNFGAGSVSDYEVALQLYGSEKLYGGKTFAEIYFVAHSSFQSYSHIWIGDLQLWDLPEMVHYFGDYETLTLEIKNQTLSIYREGQLVKSVAYNADTHIGRLKRIGVGFKGSGTTDWVKLYNSNSGAQIMQEDFDINGRSNVKWY